MGKIWNYINNQWVESQAAETVEIVNPASRELLARTPLSTQAEVNLAANAAREAWWEWRKTPAKDRVQYLLRLKNLLETNIDDIYRTITM